MENKKWDEIYKKVAAEADSAKEKSRQGLLLSQREAAVIRERELYDRMEKGGVIVATKEQVTDPHEIVATDHVKTENDMVAQTVQQKVIQKAENQTATQSHDAVIGSAKDEKASLLSAQDQQGNISDEQIDDLTIGSTDVQQSGDIPGDMQKKVDEKSSAESQQEQRFAPGSLEEQEHLEHVRAAAWHTIYKIEKYDDLNAATLNDGDKKFLTATRRLWNEFAVHGVSNGDDGKKMIKRSDLDGESSMWLLKKSGIKVERDKVVFLEPGGTREHGIIMDTSGKHGVSTVDEGKSVIVDHHAPESQRGTSAAKFLYETLVGMGLIQKEEYLDRYVDYVTRMDNFDIPQQQQETVYQNYYKNLYGLGGVMDASTLAALFKNGVDPTLSLPDDFLAKQECVLKNGTKKTLAELSKTIEDQMKKAKNEISALAREGLVLDTKGKFGKILIDPKKIALNGRSHNRVSGSYNSQQVSVFGIKNRKGEYEYGAYMIWSPEQNSYVIYTRDAMHFEPPLDQKEEGFVVRGHMWMKPRSDELLTMDMRSVLTRLTGTNIDIPKHVERALETNDLAKEIMREITTKELTKVYLRDRCKQKNVKIENVFGILVSQHMVLRRIYNQKIDEELGDLDENAKKDREGELKMAVEFLSGRLHGSQLQKFSEQQLKRLKNDRSLILRIYAESICAFGAKLREKNAQGTGKESL